MKTKFCTLLILISILSLTQAQSLRVDMNTRAALDGKFQGFSTVSIFEQCPPSSDTCMNWLAALKPNVIRFPSGGQAKFTHLTTGPGYGFDLEEIEDYYFDFFHCSTADCGAGSDYEAAVNGWILNCQVQDSLPEGERYIDDFILMINELQAQLGYTIDVLFCLNILTADAAENKAALNLLLSSGVHVTGVEMGNETYAQSGGFNNFESYLSYIQNAAGAIGDQDYIGMVRKYFPDLKIGVCAAPSASVDIEPGPGVTYAIKPDSKRLKFDDWNTALGEKWDTTRLIGSPVPDTVPQFDAAIVHFYYDGTFWSDCPAQFLEDYDANGAACCPYTFDTPDLRLAGAFDCFSAHAIFFRDSLYKRVNDYYAEHLHLNDAAHSDKKIWATEWNILEADNALETTLFLNTMAQASLVFDWQNLAYQYNTSPSYNTGFQEYRTMHNAVSVSRRNLITARTEYERSTPGDTTDIRKRMFYHVAYLMRHIADQPVNTISITSPFPDVKMYGYMDEANENLYIYYNNTGTLNTDEQFKISKIKFINAPGCHTVIDYPVTNEYIKGKQMYSGSGAAYMYDIIPLYNADNTISPEINGSKYKSYTGPKKVTLYKNSMGVIKVPVSVTCAGKLAETADHYVLAYPNPSAGDIIMDAGNADDFDAGYTIDIYDFTGRLNKARKNK